jgi:hypothetical protein
MPTTLTRSLLAVLIPGLVACASWLLVLFQRVPDALPLVERWPPPLAYGALFAIVAVVGSVIEGLASHLENLWDTGRDEAYDVMEHWYAYLSRQLDPEPVGFRYLSRMVTTLYFELGMLFAAPSFAVGMGVLLAQFNPRHTCPIVALASLAALGFIAYFVWQARETHQVLCKTRKQINDRLPKS